MARYDWKWGYVPFALWVVFSLLCILLMVTNRDIHCYQGVHVFFYLAGIKWIRAIKAKLDSFKSALRPMLSPKPRLTLHQLACCHVPWLSLMYVEMVSWGNWLSYASLSFGLADLEKYLHSKQLRTRSLKLLLNDSHKKYCDQFHQHSRGLCLS